MSVTHTDGAEVAARVRPERQIHRREVSVQLAEGDGRTLVSRLVPYNEVAVVDDGQGPYKERFLPGAFNPQMRAASRIKAFLNFRHRQSAPDQIGHAETITDLPDGLHGELRVFKTDAGDMALQAYEAGVLTQLSIEFQSMRHRVVDGVTERLDARLLGVALVPDGAYGGASVLAVREGTHPEEPVTEETRESMDVDVSFKLDPVLASSLARFGVSVPEAHLDQLNDEENDEGTSEAPS